MNVCEWVEGLYLLLGLRGRTMQASLAPDWLLCVWRVVHSRGPIRVEERLPWKVQRLSMRNVHVQYVMQKKNRWGKEDICYGTCFRHLYVGLLGCFQAGSRSP